MKMMDKKEGIFIGQLKNFLEMKIFVLRIAYGNRPSPKM
jgi:hypothetical protein